MNKVLIRTVSFAALLFFTGMLRAEEADELRFVVTGAVGADPTYANYKKLADYISDKMGKKSIFISGLTYSQTDKLFMGRQVDIGFLCNTHYALRKKEVRFEPLAAPLFKGYTKPKYQQYIIVNKDSAVKSLDDLKGKTIDLADPLSTTAIYSAYMLLQKNERLSTYFKKVVYSGSHDMTVELVAKKIVDAGFIDGHIWDYSERVSPEYSSKTKVIHRSFYFAMPPVVVSSKVKPALKKQLKEILLSMHLDPKGKEILENIQIQKYVEITSNDYNDVLSIYSKVQDSLQEKTSR